MSAIRIYNGTMFSNQTNNSDYVFDAIALYIVNPDTTLELEIEYFFQYEITSFENRLVKIAQTFITDTETLLIIPKELRNSEEKKYITFVPSTTVNLEVWALYDNQPTNLDIDERIQSLQTQLTRIELENTAIGVNQLAQNASLIAIATTVGAGLALPTAGASLLLPELVTASLAPASTALSPLLLPGV